MVAGWFGGWAKINPANVFPAPVWAHRLIRAGGFVACAAVRFSVRGAFFKGCKKSVAESVRKTKGLSGAFWGRWLFFKKRLKL